MNMAFPEFLASNPLVVSFGWTLVHFVWQAALIGIGLALVLGVMQRSTASGRYLVSCTGLLLMIAAPVGTFAWLVSNTERGAWNMQPPVTVVETPVGVSSLVTSTPAGETSAAPQSKNGTDTRRAFGTSTESIADEQPSLATTGWWIWIESFSATMQLWLPWCVVIWVVGVMCLAMRLWVGLFRVWRWKNEGAEIVGGDLVTAVSRLSAGINLRQRVRLLETARETVPAVIGWIRPAILVPTSMLSGLTTNELESILAHELAHIRRYDYLVNLLQTVVETLLFYHPAVWWLSNRIRAERENCCDDVAVAVCGNQIVFAQALARMEEIRCRGERLSVAASGGSLISRIRRIVGHESTSIGLPWPAGAMVFGSIGLLICGSWILSVANAEPAFPFFQEPQPLTSRPSMNADSKDEDVEEFETRKSEISGIDSRTGSEQRIFFGISLETRNERESRTATLGLKYSNLMRYSFIPARVAKELGAVEWGEIDFGEKPPAPNDPPQVLFEINSDGSPVVELTPQATPAGKSIHVHELTGVVDGNTKIVPYPDDAIWIPDHLGFYGMNQTQQHVFRIVRIEKVDLGVGPAFGPVTALVLDDANSDFGVLGSNWTQQVRGENGEGWWFEAATGSLVFMANPEHLKEAEARAKAAMETGQSDQEPGRMTVTSTGHGDPPPRQDRQGVKVLVSHTYPDGSRQSTGWVEVNGAQVPVDVGVKHGDVTVYKTLMFDIVAVDSKTEKTIWSIEWGKTMPMWNTVSVVELDRDGQPELALELYTADPETRQLVYQYHSLKTGEKIELLSAGETSPTREPGGDEDNKLIFISIESDGDRISRVAINAFGHGRSATELVRHFSAMDQDISKFRTGVSTTNMETIVSAVDINYLFDIATEAQEIIFNLPEGSEMRAEFSGENVEINQGKESTEVVITNGRLELIDAGGVIRAWASPDGGAEQLVVSCRVESGEVVMLMKTRRIEPSPEYPDPPVQAVLNIETGAPKDEKDPPHRGIRYEVQEGKDDGKPFVRMKMKWRYDLKRLSEEAVAESGLTLEELILGNHDPEPNESSSWRRPDESNTAFVLAALAGTLGDWNDKAAGVQFDSKSYMTLAQTLLRLDEAHRIEVLREFGKQHHEGQLVALCRMLFEPKPKNEFRRPLIGGPHFVGTATAEDAWPLEPITLVNDVPLLVVEGYTLAGKPEPATQYLEYCIQSCDWTSRSYDDIDRKIIEAERLIRQPAFWQGSQDEDEWRELGWLLRQLRPGIMIGIKQQPWVTIVAPLYLLDLETRVEPDRMVEELKKRGLSDRAPVTLLVSDNATPEWIEQLLKPMMDAGYRNIELIRWQQSFEPVDIPELQHLFNPADAQPAKHNDGDWGEMAFGSGLRSRLSLQTEKPVIGYPMLVKLEVKNFGYKPAEIDPQKYAPFRVLKVENEDFSPAAPFIGMTPQTSGQNIILQPGESHLLWENIDATALFLLTEEKDYFIFAEGGDWAAQAMWQDSNRVKVKLAPGDLPPLQGVVADLLPRLPVEWKLSTGFGAIYINHSPTNLKKDVTSIQLVFLDEGGAKKLQKSERRPLEMVFELGQTVLGEAFLIAPAEASNLWPDYKDQITQSVSMIRSAEQHGQNENKKMDAADKDKPWKVSGSVMDAEGKPLAGVTVKAHCGFGTLFQTGSGTTDEQGHYDFRFGPGGRGSPKLVQAATISVSMDGFTEKNLHRQGDCIAALEKPDETVFGDRTEEHLFLPDKPLEINFVMVPAVTVRGMVIDQNGNHSEGVRVSITGEELPPSSSVIAEVRTNNKGEFEIGGIPPGYKFQIMVEPAKAESPWLAWASAPVVFRYSESDTGLEYEIDGKPVDFTCQQLYLTLNGDGVSRKTALKEAAERKLNLSWDGLSTAKMVRAGMAFLELGEKKN